MNASAIAHRTGATPIRSQRGMTALVAQYIHELSVRPHGQPSGVRSRSGQNGHSSKAAQRPPGSSDTIHRSR
jgi:hypothetical protein